MYDPPIKIKMINNIGKLISFEGLDGCGKTTQLQKTEAWLKKEGYDVLSTRQPGGTYIGRQIREILLNPDHQELQPESELLLYLADRIQHIQEVILPAKAAGKIVLTDRFHDSTVAYQGYGRGLDLKIYDAIVQKCIKPYVPEMTFLLDISTQTIATRLAVREKDRLDSESIEFFDRVAKGFQNLAATESQRYFCLDANKDIELVHNSIISVLQEKLN